tara:strand:- start:3119 stop:3709 length:591 start_codon:yes stop_codon:yes gene_type:complete
MAVQTINTDIAAEVNITARRNDTFTFKFSVTDPTDSTAGLALNTGQDGEVTSPVYQAKMSIVDASSGDVKLNLYTAFFQTVLGAIQHQHGGTYPTAPLATPPSATTTGNYSGVTNIASGVKTGGAIDFKLNSSVLNTLATISVPYNYMTFEPGDYIYDLQVRRQTVGGTSASALLSIEYTTWLHGVFTLNPDITTL